MTGKEVTNLFEDADINYWIKDSVTYLTRQDWEGTFPTAQRNITATPEMIRQIDDVTREDVQEAPCRCTRCKYFQAGRQEWHFPGRHARTGL